MKIAVFSSKPYDQQFLETANSRFGYEITYLEPRLSPETVSLAQGHTAVCTFVNDALPSPILEVLANMNIRQIALRCAGFNQVDLAAAKRLKFKVVRVPAYSPYAVAEHAVGLMLMLNRKLHRAYNRVREGNFALQGLLGFDMHGRTIGIVGTGKIGAVVAKIMSGFECRLLGYDVQANLDCKALGMEYVSLESLWQRADIISLNCPLTPATRHLINEQTIAQMKPGVTIINTSRGAVVDTKAVIEGLKSGKIGALGLDVYEEEADYFFEDLSAQVIADDTLARLLTFPNVVVTGHQAFFTAEALRSIAETTLQNLHDLAKSGSCANEVPYVN